MRVMASGKVVRNWLEVNERLPCVIVLVCCWFVVGGAVRNTSTVTPRGNSGVKLGNSGRLRESFEAKLGTIDSKRHREGIKIGEGSRTRDPSSIRVITTPLPKGESSVDKSRKISAPSAVNGSAPVTVGYSGGSVTEAAASPTTKLHIGLVVPSKSFGVREYTKAFHAAITGLQTRTRGRKLKMFYKHDISPIYDMKPLTPSPTGKDCNSLHFSVFLYLFSASVFIQDSSVFNDICVCLYIILADPQ
jgi:hypothetical protein